MRAELVEAQPGSLRQAEGALAGWSHGVAAPRIRGDWPRFAIASGQHDVSEDKWIGVQRMKNGGDVHGRNISNAGTEGLGLDVQMGLGRIAGVAHFRDWLAHGDVITNLDLNTPRAEMCHLQIMPTADVDDDVVAALEVTIPRSDLLVRPAILDEGYGSICRREDRFPVDVVAGQRLASRLMCTPVAPLEYVERITLRRGDVMVVHQFSVSAMTDQPFIRERGCDRNRISNGPEDHHQLGGDE